MTDLDARVAALMIMISEFRYAGTHEITVSKNQIEQAIRAELQKPALHEPVQVLSEDVLLREITNALAHARSEGAAHAAGAVGEQCMHAHKTDTHFSNVKKLLQGRAKPAPLQDQRSEWLQESAYRAGASAGFNLGVSEDHDGLERLKAAHAYPCPHEFAQPAASVELPVVEPIGEVSSIFGDICTIQLKGYSVRKGDKLVKLSDAQAAIAAGRKET